MADESLIDLLHGEMVNYVINNTDKKVKRNHIVLSNSSCIC